MTTGRIHRVSRSKGIERIRERTIDLGSGVHIPFIILSDTDGNPIGVNIPLSVDGDSVYAKDVNVAGSDIGTFTGSITDLFDDLSTTISDTSATNPKTFTVKLNRPINNTGVKFCSPNGSNFSNVKIALEDISGATVAENDDSGSSTKYTSNIYDWELAPWCTMVVEFYTDDPVSLNWALMEKSQDVHAILRAAKPDGVQVDINATAGGNLKVAVEEFDSALYGPLSLATSPSVGIATDHYDETTRALITYPYSHVEIHQGNHYLVGRTIDLTNSQVFDILLVTPNTTKWSHFIEAFASEAESNVKLYEGTTTSADGTSIPSFNNNRNSANTAAMLVYHTPTITGIGTLLTEKNMGAGKAQGGSLSRGDKELILKQNTKYLVRITNNTTSNNWFNYDFEWYEHINLAN